MFEGKDRDIEPAIALIILRNGRPRRTDGYYVPSAFELCPDSLIWLRYCLCK